MAAAALRLAAAAAEPVGPRLVVEALLAAVALKLAAEATEQVVLPEVAEPRELAACQWEVRRARAARSRAARRARAARARAARRARAGERLAAVVIPWARVAAAREA